MGRKEGLVHACVVCLQGRERTWVLGSPLWKHAAEQDREMNKLGIRTSFTLPSMQHDTNWSFLMLDQSTPYTSRACSCQERMGKF